MTEASDTVTDLDAGLAHHEAGRFAMAEALYRAFLVQEPDNPDALNLLGVILQDSGELAESIAVLSRAVAVDPEFPEALANLARAQCAAGDPAAAKLSSQRAVELDPELGEAHLQFGRSLLDLDDAAGARDALAAALELTPESADAQHHFAMACMRLKDFSAAAAALREAVRLQPDNAEYLAKLGRVLCELNEHGEALLHLRGATDLAPEDGRVHLALVTALWGVRDFEATEVACTEALRVAPNSAELWVYSGYCQTELGRFVDAAEHYRKAIALQPDYPEAHNNLGNTLLELGLFAEAEMSCREALRLRPDFPEALNGLGAALQNLGHTTQAEASYRAALRLRPDRAGPHSNLGHTLLLSGRFEEGWNEFEWRWKTRQLSGSARKFSAPLWHGEPIGDRAILLHAEQGLGDTLQFCRYVPVVAAGARTILQVQAPLVRLLSTLPRIAEPGIAEPGIAKIVAWGDSLPPFDLHCPLLSLPRAFGTTLDTIPATTPYLTADPVLAAAWRERLACLVGLRVGLVWAGSSRSEYPALAAVDRRRSIALDTMAPLGETPGVSLISLQKGEPAAQADHPPDGMALHDFTADLHDFVDTAALIDGLDLVISVDTAVAHLAGALGKPVWLLNRFDTCWRWLLNRDDSPWYPTLRQFRQPAPGEWTSVTCEVRDALTRLAAGDRDQLRPRSAMI
jgi:Flp pilus assembly protein TadD